MILLVDDHPAMRAGLRFALRRHGVEIGAETGTGRDFMEKVRAGNDYQLVLLDIDLPDISGIDALKELNSEGYNVRAAMISHHKDRTHVDRAMGAGARGFFSKEDPAEVIALLIKSVLRGQVVVSPTVQSSLFQEAHMPSPLRDLTVREIEVLRMLVSGFKHKEIGEHLGIAPRTVDFHKRNIRQKLDAETMADLVRIADRFGI